MFEKSVFFPEPLCSFGLGYVFVGVLLLVFSPGCFEGLSQTTKRDFRSE